MGCDIHGVLQVKYVYTDRKSPRWDKIPWYTLGTIESGRNYALFAALAGVCNYHSITPISEPRGFPEDYDPRIPSKLFDILGEYEGDHSFSWLTLKEILEWDGWDKQTITYESPHGGKRDPATLRELCGTFLKWAEWADESHNEYGFYEPRIVFAFDS
jgi:hypothetical protein